MKSVAPLTHNLIPAGALDLRSRLQAEFRRRCRSNPGYSLRAFANFLNVDQSLLSKILSRQRAPSIEFTKKVGHRLGWKPAEIELCLKDAGGAGTYRQMDEDAFSLISESHHFAIIELAKCADFIPDIHWIASRLNIHHVEAAEAIERLERTGFLKVGDGEWQLLSPDNIWTDTDSTSSARKKLQRELLERAVSSIDTVPFEQRESGSLTVACSQELLPEVRKRILQFSRELDQFIGQHRDHDEVYQLVMSFFPLTETCKEKNQ